MLVLWWDRSLIGRAGQRYKIARTAMLSIFGCVHAPLCMGIAFMTHVAWARADWIMTWEYKFVPMRLFFNVSVPALVLTLIAGVLLHFAILLVLLPCYARLWSVFFPNQTLQASCPRCKYSLDCERDQQCPECGVPSGAIGRVAQHWKRTRSQLLRASLVLAVAALAFLLSPIWMP
jgi:hypothetical protein